MGLSYEETKKILHSEEFMQLIPDGFVLSQPILSVIENRVVDNYFVMSKKDGICNPLYKFGICFDDRELMYFAQYNNVVLPNQVTKQAGVDINQYLRYQELYGIIRTMFIDNTKIDRHLISEYLSLLIKLVPRYLINFYNDLSPEFFIWAKKYME